MKKIINSLLYDTEKSVEIAVVNRGLFGCGIKLCQTPNKRYFLYAYNCDKTIQPLSLEEAIKWCEDNCLIDVLKGHFDIDIEEA